MTVALRNGVRALEQAGALATPAAGARLLYPKADGWYEKDSAGVESKLGAMSGTKVSALTAASALDGTEQMYVVQGGTSKMATLSQVNTYAEPVSVAAVANQAPAANTDTYITNSAIPLTPGRLRAGTFARWFIHVSKTAAGTGSPVFTIRHGTAGTTADAARCVLTMSGQTATANAGVWLVVMATFRTVGAATAATLQGGVAGGPAGFPSAGAVALSAGFDSTVANAKLGLSLNTGASAAWTITQVLADLLNVA